MDLDDALDELRCAGGKTVRRGEPLWSAIEVVLRSHERLGDLYDAREAEVLELLRERNAIRRRAQQVRGGLKPYARPVEVVDFLLAETNGETQ